MALGLWSVSTKRRQAWSYASKKWKIFKIRIHFIWVRTKSFSAHSPWIVSTPTGLFLLSKTWYQVPIFWGFMPLNGGILKTAFGSIKLLGFLAPPFQNHFTFPSVIFSSGMVGPVDHKKMLNKMHTKFQIQNFLPFYGKSLMLSVLWRCWLGGRKGIRPVKNWVVGCWRGYCLERGAYLHMAQLMPLPLTVSCFSKIQIGFTFLVPAHLGIPGKRAVKHVCVCLWKKFG